METGVTTMLLTTLAAMLQTAPAAPVLTASGKWNLEYADNMCLLGRNYGTRDKPLIFGFKPAPMSDTLQLLIVSDERVTNPRFGKTEVFVNGAIFPDQSYSSHSTRTGKRITSIGFERANLASLTKEGRLDVRIDKDRSYAFAITGFDIAMRGLADCETDLLKGWGMSEAALAAIAVKPRPVHNLASYISDQDYPAAAIRTGQQGSSGVRVMVGSDGAAGDCRVVESSGSALLDETTCRIFTRRAKFEPARDHAGQPVPSLYFNRIRWVLP